MGIAFILPLIWLVDAAFNPNATQAITAPSAVAVQLPAAMAGRRGGAIKNSLYLAIVLSTSWPLPFRRWPRTRFRAAGCHLKGHSCSLILFLTGPAGHAPAHPIYQIFVRLGWDNSPFYTSLVLSATSMPFAIWLLKNFIDQVPREFEEAAAIEGSSELRILWKIVIPLSCRDLVAAILTFINSWGAFLIPLVLDANPR